MRKAILWPDHDATNVKTEALEIPGELLQTLKLQNAFQEFALEEISMSDSRFMARALKMMDIAVQKTRKENPTLVHDLIEPNALA